MLSKQKRFELLFNIHELPFYAFARVTCISEAVPFSQISPK